MHLLTDAIGLSENDKLIAQSIALLHDTARFEQFYKFRTFADARSFNHSLRAVEILREKKVLADIPPDETHIIEQAISCHGAKEICSSCNEHSIIFAKLIRDADKIDIFRIASENYVDYQDKPEGFVQDLPTNDPDNYTQSVLQAVFDQRRVSYSELQTINDVKLLQMGWVFDINFPKSLIRIRQNGHIQQIMALLPEDDQLKNAIQYVRQYMDTQIATLDK